FQYDLNGNTRNGGVTNTELVGATIENGVVSRDATTTSTGVTFATSAGTTITVSADNVVDAGSNKSSSSQVFQLYRNASLVGGLGIDTLVGTAGNDFIAGQGGNDTLTGGTGGDTFAWFLGETGRDRVTDFKVSEGDMVDLSGLLSLVRVGPINDRQPLGLNNVGLWSNYLQLSSSGDDMVLNIDTTGGGFATTTKTITFTNGALNGLNDTLQSLVTDNIIHLTAQTSTPLMLDLNGDGVQTSSITKDVMFDVQGGGQKMYTGWSDGKDGLLVLDLNNDGSITSGLELFGSATQLPSGSAAKDGFEALRQYDLNQDNLIDANDAVFAKLKVWVDTNLDGVSQSNELHGLADIGVRAFKLNAEVGHTLNNGNALSLVSTWVDIQGRDHAFVDVTFATSWQSQASHAVM
ncbi:MAG: type I secretion C-terminal target domain-containing protein, partial [Limnohabitans sp.]